MKVDQCSKIRIWDETYRNAGDDRLWPREPTIELLDHNSWRSREFRTVLDAGCGDGRNLAYLVGQGFFVIGGDASKSALIKCSRYLHEQAVSRDCVLLAPAPLEEIPLMDESVDAAICVDVLGHLEEPLPVLRELTRVLRPGGCLYASVFHIEDGCRTGPRMRPGIDARQFWYKASGGLGVEYYFRFYDEAEARGLFESSGLHLHSIESRRWEEPAHVGYRDEPHEHQSWFAMLQKGS